MSQADVTIIGAGPAGASAALHLADAGHKVVVIDKAVFPRDKCCGDGLTTAALRHLERLDIDPTTLPSWRVVNQTTWRSPSGYTIDLPVPQDGGIRIGVAKRSDLDNQLIDAVLKAGVTVHQGHTFEGAAMNGHRVVVNASGLEPISSDYVIGADGMWSPLRRSVAPTTEHYLGDIHAFRQYFTNVTGIARDRLWVSFERDLIPGYFWSFPIGDGGANVGFGIARKPGQSVAWMKDAWVDILQRPHIREVLGENAVAEGVHKAWPIPAHIRKELLSALGGRALFIGDAARVVDPLTGEGIGQALDTGELAAAAIAHAGAERPERAASRYRHAIRYGMAIDNSFARSLAKLVSHDRPARAVIRIAPRGPFKGRYAIKWAFEDNPRAALLTPWRWKQRFDDKAGAFR